MLRSKLVFLCVDVEQQCSHSFFEQRSPPLSLIHQFRYGPKQVANALGIKLVFLCVHAGQQCSHGLFELWCPLLSVVH